MYRGIERHTCCLGHVHMQEGRVEWMKYAWLRSALQCIPCDWKLVGVEQCVCAIVRCPYIVGPWSSENSEIFPRIWQQRMVRCSPYRAWCLKQVDHDIETLPFRSCTGVMLVHTQRFSSCCTAKGNKWSQTLHFMNWLSDEKIFCLSQYTNDLLFICHPWSCACQQWRFFDMYLVGQARC